MKNKKLLIAVYTTVAALIVVTAGLGITVSALNSKPEGIICEGISVNGIAMGGKTEKEAKKLLSDYVNQVKGQEIAISVTENGEVQGLESISYKDLGVKEKSNSIVEEIVGIGEKGNIIDRYKAIKSAKENKPEYNIEFKYDSKKVDKFINEIAEKYEISPEDAVLKREAGKFIVTGGKDGRTFDKETAAAQVKDSLEQHLDELASNSSTAPELEFVLTTQKPKYDKEALSMVTDLLGTFTTRYNPAGGRGQNVTNGCRLINGSVLMPGETLSANKKMEPYTVQNGYGMGTAYVNGKVVPDMGGGICQVSSTLYNAVLFSELDVVQRFNHSLSVDYVSLARDAAIAGTWKDFVFKNTSKYPIYIEGITNGHNITFNVYGHETRDVAHRKVDFSSVVLSRKNGSKAQLYKLIYENGVLKEKVLVNTSTYKPHEYEIEAAKKKAEEEKKKKEEEEKKKKEEEEKKKKEEAKKKEAENKAGSKSNDNKPNPGVEEGQEDDGDLEEGIEG